MAFPHTLRLLLAGILSLPALLLLLVVSPIIFILSIPSLALLVRRKHNIFPSFAETTSSDAIDSSSYPLLQHAVVTGGSSGIGLSIALELAKRGCENVTLLSRKEGLLAEAKRQLEEAVLSSMSKEKKATTIRTISVDITDDKALNRVAEELCGEVGPPTLLFNCAGQAIPLALEDLTPSNFRSQVKLNYLGSIYIVKAFLPYMEQQNHIGGNIVLTSSMSGQAGTYGYTAYSPTKFAIRGFAECLSMELAAHKSNVNITLAYPPDTNTPGYEVENQNKPEACRLISENGGIWEPDIVGKKIVKEALKSNPSFDIYFGVDGWMLSMLSAGMNPVTSFFDAVCQVSFMGLLRFISLFYLMDFGRITQNCIESEKARGSKVENSKKTN